MAGEGNSWTPSGTQFGQRWSRRLVRTDGFWATAPLTPASPSPAPWPDLAREERLGADPTLATRVLPVAFLKGDQGLGASSGSTSTITGAWSERWTSAGAPQSS